MAPDNDTVDRIDYTRRTVLQGLAGASLLGFGTGSALAASTPFPDEIPLPDGFQPEGITTGRGTTFYVGSLASGDIYRGDLRTGEGEVLVEAAADRVAIGLSYDRRSNYVFAAGGSTGQAFVYDGDSGESVAAFDLTDPATFVNDVVVTREAAYFTDSFRSAFYVVPLGPGGDLPEQDAVEERTLGGEFEAVDGFNANGIDAASDAAYLLIVNSTTGRLYRVPPESGDATEIDLGGETVTNGDGILLDGQTLYVVRNRNNLIAEVALEADATAGEVVDELTDSAFDVPTTVADFGDSLYAVNARFGTDNPDSAAYDVIRVSK
ncbi:hypothetical protein [Haloarcula sp. 1CSR25-25]|uniref:hypothetical protein n=1 Tax=Haloarcula sp. 1CSR25-25 TaxID=2862545 RepID=UPI002894B93C|nr:hypothetical protein [Haloarcula sp. 1CSR25-25]MDT3437393.1 hypothetical protein [Haloarcula sp. 1CSR25-25]